MKTIREKVEAIKGGERVENVCDHFNSLCNIVVNEGKVLVAAKHIVSPLLVMSPKEMDNDVPVAIYCIAVGNPDLDYMLGQEIVLDLSYGGKGVSMNTKVSNNDCKLIDLLGGFDNLDFSATMPVLKDKGKLQINAGEKIEFWDCNLINLNQIGGIVY